MSELVPGKAEECPRNPKVVFGWVEQRDGG